MLKQLKDMEKSRGALPPFRTVQGGGGVKKGSKGGV